MAEKNSTDRGLFAFISLLIGVIVGINIWMAIEGWDLSDDYDHHNEDREKWNSSQVGEEINLKVNAEEGKTEVKGIKVEPIEDIKVEPVDEVLVSKSEPEPMVPELYPSSTKALTDEERIKMEREMNLVPETFQHFVEDGRRTDDSLDTLSMFPVRNLFDPNSKVPETLVEGVGDEEEADKLAQPFNFMPDAILERILKEHNQLKHMLPPYETIRTPYNVETKNIETYNVETKNIETTNIEKYNVETGFSHQKVQSSGTDIDSEPVLNSEAALNGQVNLDQIMDAVDRRMPSMHDLTNDTSVLLGVGEIMTADSGTESEDSGKESEDSGTKSEDSGTKSEATARIPEFGPFGRNEFVHPFWENLGLDLGLNLGLNLGHQSETTDLPLLAPMDVQSLKPFMFLSEPKILKPAHHPFIDHLLRISRARLQAQGLEATTTSPSNTEILKSDGIPFFGSQYQEPELKEPEHKEPELKEPELKEPELKEPESNHDMFNSQNPSTRMWGNLQTRPVAAESMSGFYGQDPFFSGDQRFQYETVIDDKSDGSEYQGSNLQEQVQYFPLLSFNLPSFGIKNETGSEEKEKDGEKDEEETLPSQSDDHVIRKQVFRSETEPMFKQIHPSLIESRNEK